MSYALKCYDVGELSRSNNGANEVKVRAASPCEPVSSASDPALQSTVFSETIS